MPALVLASLLWGMAPLQAPPLAQVPVTTVPVRAAESDAIRIQRLRALVEAAEKAVEDSDEKAAATRFEEADVLTADWSPELLKLVEVQELLLRLKEVQEQIPAGDATEPEPGLKAQEEVVSITGEELRAESELVRSAEQGASYDYPIDLNDKVLTWVSLFSSTKRGFMENALGRASQYMPMIRQVFAEEGVPSDLAYLAVIESGFRNEAKSRAKAVGMWQFIRSTGRIYGLKGTAWVEERRDPVKATRAAARYLKRLYEITGDWYLAASSYNAGPLTLERAIQNVGTRNFWDLARSRWLRTETKNYVPELCAAILVGRNPERYGLRILPLTPYAYETVPVPSMTSLTVLARCAGTDATTLKALNPELLRGSTPPGAYLLRVPPGRAMDCLRQLAHMPNGKRLDFPGYTVKKGDTLAKVAQRFKLSPEDLLLANDLTVKQFKPGRRLLVPPPPASPVEARDLVPGIERVKALGDRPLPPLPAVPRELEGPTESPAAPRQEPAPVAQTKVPDGPGVVPTLEAPAPVPTAPAAGATLRAKAGDTLAKLARRHQVPLGELMRLNPQAAKALHPGDEVRLPGAVAAVPSASPVASFHRVQKGDALATIARKYGVEAKDLKAWNGLKGDRIQVGQKLRLAPR
ncbi:MAG: LysM peptidoglycan-binding domain-containing protein [Geothrix sp.]|uniref:LysM peptidoglycan-binding domain-containing protein n=1 Tax=Geothrix sp. TaxID=1962974 RepID=UPI001824E709|nr:LysM peptidoglycan-binding domain-containing protein [Geothrix sp.]NWJ39616.1 LysM peptidoglycan-binding domain-containing protein [Geothrix sp.]WIL22361.1 MAG: LysM peptidoglycan-binding domain-containing protein [Geothrix sp.]